MSNYLGQQVVSIDETPYANYTSIDWALYFIERYGQIDGDHHKLWVLDQVARVLKKTPVTIEKATWGNEDNITETEWRVNIAEPPSKEYLQWVEDMKGEVDADGETEYGYDEGIAP